MLRLLASTEIELYLIMCCLRLYDCYSGEPVICVKIMVILSKRSLLPVFQLWIWTASLQSLCGKAGRHFAHRINAGK